MTDRPFFDTRATGNPDPSIQDRDQEPSMRMREPTQEIDAEVLLAAREAARRAGSRFVIGWWIEGAERRLMLLPEGHHVTEEPPFFALMRVTPSGRAEPIAA